MSKKHAGITTVDRFVEVPFSALKPGDVCSFACSAGSLHHVVCHLAFNHDLKKWFNLCGRTTAKDNKDTRNGITYRLADPDQMMRHFPDLKVGRSFNVDARDTKTLA